MDQIYYTLTVNLESFTFSDCHRVFSHADILKFQMFSSTHS